MTDTKDDGGPAFPAIELAHNQAVPMVRGGMSLRDWFAGMAMQGMLINGPDDKELGHIENSIEFKVAHCFRLADAMLEARKK